LVLLRHDQLTADFDTLVGRERLCLTRVQTLHSRALMENERGHYRTSKAPLLMETIGPVSLIDAPIPLSISIPVALILIFWPPEVSKVIPPMPGVSSRRMLLPPRVLIITFVFIVLLKKAHYAPFALNFAMTQIRSQRAEQCGSIV
jgi:hypothetical protein